ncbi:hypothetical protein GX51_07188 [Blastomyces parvus]|uniref:BTB domain-containing protein n=1 Tax=Blastomyces parvus TaxID=2060905 RepID=A0A2B7WMB3_9EURO|nr:hypothetical protein GX51_07188 [Blastomyces parvus]
MSAPLSLPSTSSDEMGEPQAICSDEMGEPQVIQIASNSDICLEVCKMPEKTKFHLQVSSQTLCEASNRFNREFNSSWKESIERAEANSASGKTCVIQLFDDDVDALILLFHVLHHKIQAIPVKPTHSQLLELAVVAEKYFCVQPLFPWTVVWLQEYSEDLESAALRFEWICELLYFSYIVDVPDVFDKISKAILLKYPAYDFHEFPEHFLVRGNLLAEFKAKNAEMFLQIHEFVEKAIQEIQNGRCAGRAHFIVRIREALNRSLVWPLTIYSREFSISDICTQISEICICGTPLDSSLVRNCSCWNLGDPNPLHGERYCQIPQDVNGKLKRWLELNLRELFEDMDGVCLDCVKTSGESRMKRKCRLPHWEV